MASLLPAVTLQKRSSGDEMILITCEDVRRELSNYFDDEVTLDLRLRIDEHVRSCHGCKALYDGVRNVLMLAGSGEIIELPRGFSLRLFQRLQDAH
jgi:putative zinc finger protein